jgi:AraC-like DNA-binding protein
MGIRNSLTLAGDRALYLGELEATGWHRHASPVLLIGLSGRFALHLPHGGVEPCRSALVGAGVDHVFDPCGEQVALMYLEPDSCEARSLREPLAREGVVLEPVRPLVRRDTAESRLRSFDLAALLAQPLQAAAPIDARVARSLRLLRTATLSPLARDRLAGSAALSSSHFNHLFRKEMGVSFRSYRVWSQVRLALGGLAAGGNLTDAAMHGAFSDSAHFSRTFRQTFGMTPSSVIRPLREVVVL